MDQGTLSRNSQPASFNLRELIAAEKVEPHFQPIVSLKRRAIVGVEGLSRGIHPAHGGLIPPSELFHQANVQGLQVELDRLCRKKVMDDFRVGRAEFPERFLSLNLDVSIFDQGVVGSGHLRQQVTEMGLEPSQIALEIIESAVDDLDELRRFVELYRGYGFLIALDDVGAGYSNLNRIPLIKPDILKIDRFLVQDIQKDFYKQEVLRSLVNMSRRLGTLIIAEGVETQEEAVCLLEMDVDMIQGYYFSKPQRRHLLEEKGILERIDGLGGAFKQSFLKRVGVRKINMNRYYAMLMEMQMELSLKGPAQFDAVLKRMCGKFDQLESLYVLEENGTQASEYVFHEGARTRRNSVVFRPSPKGSDHTMKDYYYFLMEAGLNKTSYVTEPYLSMASGNSCVTLSALFNHTNGKRYILCLDITTKALGAERTK